MKTYILYMLAFGLLFISCEDDLEKPKIPDFVLAGGETTVFDRTSYAYTLPLDNISPDNFERHLEGDIAFEQIFVTPPAEHNAGLGPIFNNNSCVSCHVRNGRSKAVITGEDLTGSLIRMSVPGTGEHGSAKAVPGFGTQLQNKAVFGTAKEGSFISFEVEKIITFLNGETQKLTKRNYEIVDTYMPLPDDLLLSPRVAPSVFGIGLLEAIPTERILELEDINDQDNDGISGKANKVWSVEKNEITLGRFGWKAENPSSIQQTADAFHQDMGITSPLFVEESCASQDNCHDNDGLADIDQKTLENTAFYFQTLAVPAVRDYQDADFLLGQELFETIQCSTCHTPSHTTGISNIEELSGQTIYPYTDLLLHDMGEDLSDNRPSFEAIGNEWRTPPLWGIGLLPVVNGHMQLLHDGRAETIDEAILWHGGEAENSRNQYMELSDANRDALLKFVKSI